MYDLNIEQHTNIDFLGAKLVVMLKSPKGTTCLNTIGIYDSRIGTMWEEERINDRGVTYFLDLKDLKETCNWNLYGDDSKYKFKWVYECKEFCVGYAYIYEFED